MEQRLSLITLGVSDLKRARAFYDALGWKSASEEHSEEVVAYNLQSMALCLYPLEMLSRDAGISCGPSGNSVFSIAHNVASELEVDQTLIEAERAGGKIIKPGHEVFWGGYVGYFADPDGHLWEVAYNPFFPLGPKGEFQWGEV
ncbi:MAG: glyoxalase [Nitrospinae bacterium CG11_big_fil_rev_8_21_14_0_20_56_8]|nr:MAG: glyoxalase [Nitrospinae bacterium CG11_big_fil_rev_8_21_14_0_20_56_8]